jgi:hypothetical protein
MSYSAQYSPTYKGLPNANVNSVNNTEVQQYLTSNYITKQ